MIQYRMKMIRYGVEMIQYVPISDFVYFVVLPAVRLQICVERSVCCHGWVLQSVCVGEQ